MRKIALFFLLSGWSAAQPWKVHYPKFPVVAPAGQWVELEVEGPIGKRPILVGPSQSSLEEVSAGLYRGRFLSGSSDLRIDQEVLGRCEVSPGLLGVFEVSKPSAVFRCGPSSDFDRLTPVVAGTRFEVLQRQGDYYQVSPPLGWIKVSDGQLLPAEASVLRSRLTSVKVLEPANQVRFRLGAPCAWQVQEDVEGRKLWLDLPGVPMAIHEVAFAQDARRLPSLRVLPNGTGTRVEIPLRQRLWGYATRWDGQDLVLDITPAPKIDGRQPLRGLKVTLDAGHGGQDSGTVGLEKKVKEKDLNLAVTLALKAELVGAGAQVTLTRAGDHQVAPEDAPADSELQSRVDIAERSGAQLFVSIHHNARANVSEGRVSHGTDVYYYQHHSRGLAQAIAAPLAKAIGEPRYRHLWRSFHVVRQTKMPSVLVEVNYLSNPKLEAGMLARPDFPQKAARAIRLGMENFLRADP